MTLNPESGLIKERTAYSIPSQIFQRFQKTYLEINRRLRVKTARVNVPKYPPSHQDSISITMFNCITVKNTPSKSPDEIFRKLQEKVKSPEIVFGEMF